MNHSGNDDREFKHFEELVMGYAGSITVRSFPRFAARISTMDIKNGIAEYCKINGYSPDLVIIDSMDFLTDGTRRQWGAERNECLMRLHVAKSRFFHKGDTIKIATDDDNEVFYDTQRSMSLQQMEEPV